MTAKHTYLALGDSMSIDDYTGVDGGGAVNQLYRKLGEPWVLDDRTHDGCCMPGVPRDGHGDLITLTIGGNDLLSSKEKYLLEGLDSFSAQHRRLLAEIRKSNPAARIIVGDIYAPATPLADLEASVLAKANAAIHANCQEIGAWVAAIHTAFRGHEERFLCLNIEPTLDGAEAIARLFHQGFLEGLA